MKKGFLWKSFVLTYMGLVSNVSYAEDPPSQGAQSGPSMSQKNPLSSPLQPPASVAKHQEHVNQALNMYEQGKVAHEQGKAASDSDVQKKGKKKTQKALVAGAILGAGTTMLVQNYQANADAEAAAAADAG